MTKRQNPHLSAAAARTFDYEPLVRAAATGDKAAVEQLLMRAQEVGFRFSLLVCGHAEDAEDVMQEALLRTYRHVGQIKRPEAFRTWLYRTVRNACLMKRRRRVDEPSRLLSLDDGGRNADGARVRLEVKDGARPPDEAAMNRWLGRRLRSALSALPPAYRMIVILREVEGLSTREVSSIAKMSEANVKTRLHRARVMLRERLGDL